MKQINTDIFSRQLAIAFANPHCNLQCWALSCSR